MELQKKWFVYMDDHHEGPFSPDEIYKKQKSGTVTQESYVWCEGMSDWQMLEQVAELKNALAQFKEPPAVTPAPSQTPLKLTPTSKPKPEPVSTRTPGLSAHTPSMIETVEPKSGKRSVVTTLLTVVILLLLLCAGAAAILSRVAGEDMHAMLRPTLVKILDRVPALSPLFKLTPKVADVKPEDLAELEAAMIGEPANGVKFALALSNGDPNRPYFYVATNLPDRTKLDVYLIGNGETLLNRLSFSIQSAVSTKFGLGKTEVLLAVGGQPIPKGEYQVYLVESGDQEEAIRAVLNSLPANRVQTKTPPEVPMDTKFLFTRTFFIGGDRDDTYLTRLKAFHEKVKQSADREVQELKQYTDTLQLQYTSLTTEFGKMYRIKKMTPQQKAAWNRATASWQQINGQMDQTIQTWTKETLQNEFFYGKTYELIKSAHESIQKLFKIESGFIEQPSDRASFEIEHGKALSEARDALELLKTKVDVILKSPKTASGLPTREGP